jgi:hypothetical protein
MPNTLPFQIENMQSSIRTRWSIIDWKLYFPWWRLPAKVRILMYVDGSVRFNGGQGMLMNFRRFSAVLFACVLAATVGLVVASPANAAGVFKRFQNNGNRLCLTAGAEGPNAAIIQEPCKDNAPEQGWKFTKVSGTRFTFLNQLGFCMNAFSGPGRPPRTARRSCCATVSGSATRSGTRTRSFPAWSRSSRGWATATAGSVSTCRVPRMRPTSRCRSSSATGPWPSSGSSASARDPGARVNTVGASTLGGADPNGTAGQTATR